MDRVSDDESSSKEHSTNTIFISSFGRVLAGLAMSSAAEAPVDQKGGQGVELQHGWSHSGDRSFWK